MSEILHAAPVNPVTGRAALGGRARKLAAATKIPSPAGTGGPTVGIYLAGKISKNGWRSKFVPGLRGAGGDEYADAPTPLDIGGGLIYHGPFFVSCDHGCAHGGHDNHAMLGGCINTVQGDGWTWKHGGDDTAIRDIAVRRCLDQINAADLIIAVVSGDAHGTLVEIGYAVGIGKKVIVTTSVDCGCMNPGGFDSDQDFDDGGAWFPFSIPGVGWSCCANKQMVKLGQELALLRDEMQEESLCESPVELAFLGSIRKRSDLRQFKPNVTVMGGKYRIDFADADRKIGVEIDGHAYHSDKETFAKDRVRQRELEMDGWRIVRYSGQEVHRDADACVGDFVNWLAAVA